VSAASADGVVTHLKKVKLPSYLTLAEKTFRQLAQAAQKLIDEISLFNP
jgi:hypothetical protein